MHSSHFSTCKGSFDDVKVNTKWLAHISLLVLLLSNLLGLCNGEGPRKARWTTNRDATISCPKYLHGFVQETGLPVCDRASMAAQRYLNGSWVKLPEGCYPRSHRELAQYAYGYEQECDNPEFKCGSASSSCEEKVVRLAQWAWSPTSCRLLPFDASFLSQKMAGKRVQFIGDSTMRQQFWALGLMMKGRGLIDANMNIFAEMEWTTRHNATFSVEGVQFLTGAMENEPERFDPSMEKASWLNLLDNSDYFVFNTGFHHHRRDPEFIHYQEMVDIVLSAIHQRTRPGQKLFFQSSVTPHVDCEEVTNPLDSYELEAGAYSWDLPLLNEWRWAKTAKRLGMTNLAVLNVSMSHLRADGHVAWKILTSGRNVSDCLHQCSPGIPDYYNWLVAHALMLAS